MAQYADLEAINRYMVSTPRKTKKANQLHDEWLKWWEGITWYEKAWDKNTFDVARNMRNNFNLANTVTREEKEHVQQVIGSGLSNEEMTGGTDRRLSTGMYTENLISTSSKVAIASVVGGGLIAWLGISIIENGNPFAVLRKHIR